MGSNPWRCYSGHKRSDCRPSGHNMTGQGAATGSGSEEVRLELPWFSLKTEKGQGGFLGRESHTRRCRDGWRLQQWCGGLGGVLMRGTWG